MRSSSMNSSAPCTGVSAGSVFKRAGHDLDHGRVRAQAFGQHLHLEVVVGDDAGGFGGDHRHVLTGSRMARAASATVASGATVTSGRRPEIAIGGQFAAQAGLAAAGHRAQALAQACRKNSAKAALCSSCRKTTAGTQCTVRSFRPSPSKAAPRG